MAVTSLSTTLSKNKIGLLTQRASAQDYQHIEMPASEGSPITVAKALWMEFSESNNVMRTYEMIAENLTPEDGSMMDPEDYKSVEASGRMPTGGESISFRASGVTSSVRADLLAAIETIDASFLDGHYNRVTVINGKRSYKGLGYKIKWHNSYPPSMLTCGKVLAAADVVAFADQIRDGVLGVTVAEDAPDAVEISVIKAGDGDAIVTDVLQDTQEAKINYVVGTTQYFCSLRIPLLLSGSPITNADVIAAIGSNIGTATDIQVTLKASSR
jgi:hypothetical protein